MVESVECVVVGAGVVGLAIARALALEGREVVVLEAEQAIGTHTSSRNSEVIHAGIYYPTNSLKARTCVDGNALLYDYCRQRGVNFKKPGKLIIATNDTQIGLLDAYLAQGRANGVDDLELISKGALGSLEPEVRGMAALKSPSTGIVDSHGLMLSLLGDVESAGGMLALRSMVREYCPSSAGFDIDIETGGTSMTIQSRVLINSAGHGAIGLAGNSGSGDLPCAYYPAGHYFSYQGKSPFRHLVYPVAGNGSLGVHGTLDLGGQLKFGPDIQWRDHLDYTFDLNESRRQHFESSIRDYYPGLGMNRMQPGYVGVRPRISGPREPAQDFRIEGPENHGIRGLVQLFGIESPGLTACLSIANEAVSRLSQD